MSTPDRSPEGARTPPPTAPPPPINTARTVERINRALFFVGALFAFVGLRFFLDPGALRETTVGRALAGPWDDLWSAMFVIGGLLIMAGIGTRRPRLELPGLTLLGTSVVVYGCAVVLVAGERGAFVCVLCVLVLWVLDGRRRDIGDLPRERRRGRGDRRKAEHPTPPPAELERRQGPDDRRHPTDELVIPPELRDDGGRAGDRLVVAVPALAVTFAAAPPDLLATAIIALLGGGIVTAIGQAFLIRPQRRDLEGRLSATAVQTAQDALDGANDRIAELRAELNEARERHAHELGELAGRLEETVHRCDELEAALRAGGLPVPPAL